MASISSALTLRISIGLGFLLLPSGSGSAQSVIDLDQELSNPTPLQRGSGASEFRNSNQRGYQNLPGTDFNSLQSDVTPYVSDYPLAEDEYMVGPGDVFQLHFEATSLEKQVTPEGYIALNRIGIVRLEGLTLRVAKERLMQKLSTAYRRSECFVALSRPKTMRIFVTGAVNKPGPYDIPGNFRVADAIRYAGGYAPSAQKGDVAMTVGDSTGHIRLEKFLVGGDLKSNPYLRQGAIVHVPFVDYSRPWVTVRRDGASLAVQLDSGETITDAVFRSYSFVAPAPYTALLVKEQGGHDTLISAAAAAAYRPLTGAYIEVIPARQEIFVAGAVAAPGLQPHVSDRKIIQYISTAGLLTSSKVPNKIEVIRVNGKRVSLPIQSADLRPGDVLFVRQNTEQKFLIYTPILLSFVSLSLAVITVFGMN